MGIRSIGILNGDAFERMRDAFPDAPEIVRRFDLWWLTARALHSLRRWYDEQTQAIVEGRSYLYFNRWGCAYYSIADLSYPAWQPGPGDVYGDFPRIRSERGPYPYRIDSFWSETLARMIFNVASSAAYRHFEGIALDDWQGDVNYWNLSPDERAVCWPTAPPLPPRDWDAASLRIEENYIRALAALRGKRVLVNGRARLLGPRLFESFGEWESPESVLGSIRSGDAIVVRGIRADRESWGSTTKPAEISGFPIGTSFRDVFRKACAIAAEKDAYLGLALCETPPEGGSVYNYHKFFDPLTWEAI